MEESQSRHILGLDLIRFAAAAMVMIFHYDHGIAKIPYSWTGWVGVEIFFVLSGFVISFSAESATATSFLKSRIVRLMPCVWVCGTITALVAGIAHTYADLPARYLSTLILWPAGPWIDGSYWTLPIEVSFYALVYLTLFNWKRFLLPVVLESIALLSGAFWFARSLLQFYPHMPFVASFINNIPGAVGDFAMLNFGSYFAIGGLLWLCVRRGVSPWRIGLVFLCLGAGAIQIIFVSSFWVPAHGQRIIEKLIPVVIWLAFNGAIVASVLGNGFAWRLLGRHARLIRLIGLATYPLYLLHDVIGAQVMAWTKMPIWLLMGIMICFSFAIAAFVEPRAQKWLRACLYRP